MKIVEQHVLGPLRHQTFFSLAEANTAVQALVDQLNRRPFQKMPGSRRTRWEQEERPALQALPAQRYEFAEWRHARVHMGPPQNCDHAAIRLDSGTNWDHGS